MLRFRKILTLMLFLICLGSCGYAIIEGWNVFDAIYMTVITLSTVGYGETHDLTQGGRLFTAILIPTSVCLMACFTAEITSVLVSGQISGEFRARKERRMISQMKNHTIVCGGGVTASTVIRRLAAEGKDVVAITNNSDEVSFLRRMVPDVPIIEDDPKAEMGLIDANLLNAKYLVAATDSDVDNLLITITGRGIGTKIHVISCSQSTELASRMLKVGADEVISSQVLGGEHVANLIERASETTIKQLETVETVQA